MGDAVRTPALVLMLLLTGCGAVASSPSWVGGGMAVTGPVRTAREEAELDREIERQKREPDEVSARHVLVMHAGSKARPETITRSREEARARAQGCLEKLRAGTDFGAVVSECTDEPGAAERGGDLGSFRRDEMVKPFSEAAFALKVGEISEVVETVYGFHIIKRVR